MIDPKPLPFPAVMTPTELRAAWQQMEPEHRGMILRALYREGRALGQVVIEPRREGPDSAALVARTIRACDAYRVAIMILEEAADE